MIKKLFAFLLAVTISLSLFSCSDEKYPPVESTEEEARTVITLKIENKEYEVRYELYRALFLNNKAKIDGGDEGVWTSENKQQYIDEINQIIITDLSEIYAVLHLADEIGFDAYSAEVNEQIKEYIIGAVEGDENQIGHGSYDQYLASLKKNNLNYSVATLMLRYAIAENAIYNYYHGEYDEIKGQQDGKFEYSKEDVKEYYYSDSSRRILQAYFQTGIKDAKQIADYRATLLAINDEKSLAAYIIGSTMATESDFIKDDRVNGITVGKTELYSEEYRDYITAVFSTDEGKLSSAILLDGTNADGYYIIYNLKKDEEHFESSYEDIRVSYIDNIIGGMLKNIARALSEGVKYADGYSQVNHADISMD